MFPRFQALPSKMLKSFLITSCFQYVLLEPIPKEKLTPHIFADRCVHELPSRPSDYTPYTVLSICHLRNDNTDHLKQPERLPVKPLPRFSSHSFIIRIANLGTWDDGFLFEAFYERLFIPLTQRQLFEIIGTNFIKEFQQLNPSEVKKELLRRRWNLDTFIIFNSPGAVGVIQYNEYQMPTSIQQQDHRYQTNNVSDMELVYYINSGYGQQCHSDLMHALSALTYDFTAYDRIFCDAYMYHGLGQKVKPYWNIYDIYFFRGRLIRDGLLSYFPPDTANAVYFGSPKLTFVILHRKPITWLFVVRPFKKSLWMFLFITFCTLEIIWHLKQIMQYFDRFLLKRKMLKKNLFAVKIRDDGKLEQIGNRYANVLSIYNGILRIILASVYSGMILVGILHPLYPWTPNTFKDLNSTKNYFVGTAEYSPFFILDNLLKQSQINGIPQEMWQNRTKQTPAEHLEYSVSDEFIKENPDKFYAAVMYDDKMNLWMKGRFIIWKTSHFLSKLMPANDHVLPEIRYVSVAPGATRLHFLIKTMRRVFTSGTWMRWYYLEQNYYKNVAPVIAVNKERDMGREPKNYEFASRQLNIHDLFSVFGILGIGLFFGFGGCMFEIYTTCEYTQQL